MPLFGRKLYAFAGVMFYRDPATGELIPVAGTPTDGQVPAYAGGVVTWAAAATGLPAIPTDADDVPYVLGILGGAPAWRVFSDGALADALLASDGAVLLAPDGGALTPA